MASVLKTFVMVAKVNSFCSGVEFKTVHGGTAAGIMGDMPFIKVVFALIDSFMIAESTFAFCQTGPDSPPSFGGVQSHLRSCFTQREQREVTLFDDIVLCHAVDKGDHQMEILVDDLSQYGNFHIQLFTVGSHRIPVFYLELSGGDGDS